MLVAFCIKEAWSPYHNMRKGFGYDWSEAVSPESD
jgi:hypothetical protein